MCEVEAECQNRSLQTVSLLKLRLTTRHSLFGIDSRADEEETYVWDVAHSAIV